MEKRPADENLLKPLEEQLRCRICSEFYSNCTMAICGHNFCSTCIKQRLTTDDDCPICYEVIKKSDLRSNILLDTLARFYKKIERNKTSGSSETRIQKNSQRSVHTESDIQILPQNSNQSAVNSSFKSTSRNSPFIHSLRPILTDLTYPIKLEVADYDEADVNDVVIPTNSVEKSYEKKFAIVKFMQDDNIEVVPSKWLINEREGWWPSSERFFHRIVKCIKECVDPEDSWEILNLEVLSYSKSFKNANKKAEKALNSDHVTSSSSEDEILKPRKRKKNSKYFSSEERSPVESNRFNPSSKAVRNFQKKKPSRKFTQSQSSISPQQHHSHAGASNSVRRRVAEEVALPQGSPSVLKSNDAASVVKKIDAINAALEQLSIMVGDIKTDQAYLISLHNKAVSDNKFPTTIMGLPEGVEFPLFNHEGLVQLDEKLKIDANFQRTFMQYFDWVCNGRSVKYFLLNLCRKLITKDLAMQYSRLGRKGKRSFEDLTAVTSTILATVSCRFKEAKREDIAEHLGRVLAQASDWYGRPKSNVNEPELVIQNSGSLELETFQCL